MIMHMTEPARSANPGSPIRVEVILREQEGTILFVLCDTDGQTGVTLDCEMARRIADALMARVHLIEEEANHE